ncbi:MAG: hypothetical protein LBV80_02325 [Deltaproteobacteria bacterium]|nr:hypothetical protein [Deltaproteobacteria bacterium]
MFKFFTVLFMLVAFIGLPVITDYQLGRAFGFSVRENTSILAGAIDLFVGLCGASVVKRSMAALFDR